MILLDNRMFDDGSIDCKNFFIATHDSSYVCEYDHILKHFSLSLEAIRYAIEESKPYVVVTGDDGIEYEVSWD